MPRIAALIASTAAAGFLVYEWKGAPWLAVAAVSLLGGVALAVRDIRRRG